MGNLLVLLLFVARCGARNWEELNACAARILEQYASERIMYIFELGYEMYEVLKSNKSRMVFLDQLPFQSQEDDYTRTSVFLSLGTMSKLLRMLDVGCCTDVIVVIYHGYNFEEKAFELFWFFYYNKVVYVNPSLDVYTYYPISEGNCTTASPILLGKCESAEVKFREEGAYISNCVLNVHCIEREPYAFRSDFETIEGVEVAILRQAMAKLKIRVLVKLVRLDNYIYRKIYYRSVDMLCGGLTNKWPTFGAVYSGILAEQAAFVPRATPKEPAENILEIFDLATWLSSVSCFVIFTMLWAYLSKDGITTTFIFTLSSVIASVPRMPSTNRPLFVIWLLVAMVATNAFMGLLTSFMFHPTLHRQLDSISELVKQDWDIEEASRTLFFRMTVPEQYIVDHMYECYDPEVCFQQLHKDKWAYYDDVRRTVRLLKKDRTLTLHKFYETVYPVHFVLHPRSLFIERLAKAVNQLVEGGLIEMSTDWNSVQVIPSMGIQAIKLRHVYFIFAVVSVGHFLALISFALEIVVRF